MCGAIHPFPQHVFIAWCLIKHRIRLRGVFIYLNTMKTSPFYLYLWSATSFIFLSRQVGIANAVEADADVMNPIKLLFD
jgi:hypothetical protein